MTSLALIARASILVTPVVTGGPPTFTYSYTVQNIGNAALLEVSITISGSISNVTAPNGWLSGSFPSGSETVIIWVSRDVPFDIVKGASLSGFGFVSSGPPGNVVVSTLSDSLSADTATTIGPIATTTGPVTAIPLSGSVLLIGPALIAIGIRSIYINRIIGASPPHEKQHQNGHSAKFFQNANRTAH